MGARLRAGDEAPNFRFDSPWRASQDFFEVTRGHDAVLVFLRYHGCPVCRMEMAQLRRDAGLFTERRARLFVVLQSPIDTVRRLLRRDDWPFEIVCDPTGDVYRRYAVEAGGVMRYLHPAGLVATAKALCSGASHGRFEGRETQLPAVFVIGPDRIVKYAHYGTHIGDVPAPSRIAAQLD